MYDSRPRTPELYPILFSCALKEVEYLLIRNDGNLRRNTELESTANASGIHLEILFGTFGRLN